MKLYKYFTHKLIITGFILVVVVLYYSILNTETFLKNPYHVKSTNVSLVSYIPYILPSLIYILLKLYACKKINKKNIKNMLYNKELLDVEILIMLIIVLFPLTMQYFKGIQIHLAYILLMSHYNYFYKAITSNNKLIK